MKISSRLTPQPRWWDLVSFFMLFILLTIAFTRLVATDWTRDLGITRTITYLGLIAGLALGLSRFSPRWVFIFALAYGAFVISWRIGLSLGESIEWQERLLSLVGRLATTISYLVQRKAVPDNLLFLLLMALLFWVLSVHAGYHLTRYANPWNVIIPTGITLVLIHQFDSFFSNRVWYLVAYLFFALLVVARLAFLHNQDRWLKSKIYMPPYLGLDLIRIALISGVVLLLLSWAVPALAEDLPAARQAWQRLKQPLNEFRGTLDNAFASLRSTVGTPSEFYGATTSLGRGALHSDSQVFSVITPQEIPAGLRYYWRARVYDVYENGQWSSTLDTSQTYDPEDSTLQFPEYPEQVVGFYSFAFTTLSPVSSLFTINQPVWLSRPGRAEMAINPDGTVDLGHIRAMPMIQAGESYNLRAKLANVTIAAMQEAGTDYPEWVSERYLQIPDSVTDRTVQLASDITAGLITPYEKAAAITQYLRETIEYSEVITAPLPINQEPIDWFLFDLQQGFCNYYATSEVILLRAAGVPARIAYGYAQGELVEGTTTYEVRQYDAHAWPEVYYPNIGWVEFEPTVSQPDIVRPVGEDPNALSPGLPFESQMDNSLGNIDRPRPEPDSDILGELPDRSGGMIILAVMIVLVVLMIVLLVPLIRRRRLHEKIPHLTILLDRGFRKIGIRPPQILRDWAYRAQLSPISKAYMEINLALTRLGKAPASTDTPAERAASLGKQLPPSAIPAEVLVREYHLATYSPKQSSNELVARQAAAEIRRFSYRAIFQRWLNR